MEENVLLTPLTTLKVGGPARYFATVAEEAGVQKALDFAHEKGLPYFVLGGGSNIVVADAGFPGVVIVPTFSGVTVEADGETAFVTVGAGESWDEFVSQMVAQNLAGVECLAGIPGTVGATPVQNVGAYGQEVAETMVSVRAMQTRTGQVHTLSNADCRFGYRKSRFNSDEMGQWLILSVTFALKVNGAPCLKYADLIRYFAHEAESPTLARVAGAVREIRAAKGMVIDGSDPDTRSAGSFFKNPVLTQSEFVALQEAVGNTVPHYPQTTHEVWVSDTVKVPAAWLIEQAGFRKGQCLVGSVALSTKHVLALTNRGGATAADIVESARLVQAKVREHQGVCIVPEPLFVGFTGATVLPDGAVRVGSE